MRLEELPLELSQLAVGELDFDFVAVEAANLAVAVLRDRDLLAAAQSRLTMSVGRRQRTVRQLWEDLSGRRRRNVPFRRMQAVVARAAFVVRWTFAVAEILEQKLPP